MRELAVSRQATGVTHGDNDRLALQSDRARS
jgi:hypothetical protein